MRWLAEGAGRQDKGLNGEQGMANDPSGPQAGKPGAGRHWQQCLTLEVLTPLSPCAAWPRVGASQALVNRLSGAPDDREMLLQILSLLPMPAGASLPCPCTQQGMWMCGAGMDIRTSVCHPAETLFLQHIRQLNDAALVCILLPLSVLAKSYSPAKFSVAVVNKTTPGWCHPMAASGTPLQLSPSSLWLCLQSLVAQGTASSAGRKAVMPGGGGNKATKAPPPVPAVATTHPGH